jgi:hypothetical protein
MSKRCAIMHAEAVVIIHDEKFYVEQHIDFVFGTPVNQLLYACSC